MLNGNLFSGLGLFPMKMNDKDDFRESLAHGKDIPLLRLF